MHYLAFLLLLFWSFFEAQSRPQQKQNEYQLPGLASLDDLEAVEEAAVSDNCWALLDQYSWSQVISFDERTSTIRINFQHTKAVPPSQPNKLSECLKGKICTYLITVKLLKIAALY